MCDTNCPIGKLPFSFFFCDEFLKTYFLSMPKLSKYVSIRPNEKSLLVVLSKYSQLPPCGHLAITDSSKIPGESYRRLTEINSRYYGFLLLRTYGHFIRSQCHNFIVFSLMIVDTEQHLGILAHISSLFFLLFETVFVFFVQNISAFLIHRGQFKVANEFSVLGDKVGEVAVQRRSTQSRLERYFKAM